jgi:hypothetical protein
MDTIRTLFQLLLICVLACPPAFAQFPGSGGDGGDGGDSEPPSSSESDSQQRQNSGEKAANEESENRHQPTELDLPVDEKIKVKVEPFVPGSVVDRLVEPSTVTVECPGAQEVDLYVVPVDAPYGGKAVDRPRRIGRDDKPANGLKVDWATKEYHPYVKVFVVVRKKGFGMRRSRTLDFGMSGARFEAKPEAAPSQPSP